MVDRGNELQNYQHLYKSKIIIVHKSFSNLGWRCWRRKNTSGTQVSQNYVGFRLFIFEIIGTSKESYP